MTHFIQQGEGIPLVFQHGLSADAQQIKKLIGNMKGVQLTCVDCPGHGQSALPSKVLPSFDYYCQTVVQCMDELKIEKAYLGGISMGSGIALRMALHFPERVKGLILVRPAWLDTPNPDNLKILTDASPFIGQVGGERQFQQLAAFRQMKQALPLAADSVMGVFGESQRKELPKVLKAMVNDCPIERLEDISKIKVPCLIIANDDDPLHPYEMAVTLHENIPGSILKKVTSRYVDNDAHGKIVNKLVTAFLQIK